MIDFFKSNKKEILLQLGLIFIALVLLSFNLNQHPLVDYDEASYAKVTLDTMKGGDILTLQLSGRPWFAKPPLYFWLSMISVKIFGTQDFVFRLPSVVMGGLALWLIFLIVKSLTGDKLIAASAFFILLFSPPIYAFFREARLDSGVIAATLSALFCTIVGWKNNKYLLWVFPSVAVGFLFKTFVAVLIIPTIFIYCLFYKQWRWVKSKYLWIGLLVSLVILAPWHILQFQRFGYDFWNVYFIHEIYERSVSLLTGPNNRFDYVVILWKYYQPWAALILLLMVSVLIFLFIRKAKVNKSAAAALVSALFILVFFTFIKSHLSTYILPAFPFLAMFIAISLHDVFFYPGIKSLATAVLFISLIIGSVQSLNAVNLLVQAYHYEEKNLALIFKQQNYNHLPLYVLDWPYRESLSYYGDTDLAGLDVRTDSGRTLAGPFYLVTNTLVSTYFHYRDGRPLDGYEGVKEVYKGNYLYLIQSDKDLRLPEFSYGNQ